MPVSRSTAVSSPTSTLASSGLSPGSVASKRSMIAASSRLHSGACSHSGANCPLVILVSVSWALRPANGRLPVSASYKMTPSENKSERPSCGCPLMCSGAMYAGEPSSCPVEVTLSLSTMRAMPKSHSTSVPGGRTMMFSGFTSRCTMPMRCAVSRALAISTPIMAATSGKRGRCESRTARSVGPSINSVTR